MILRFIIIKMLVAISLFAATITLDKDTYRTGENITITLTQMPGNDGDWVGIYPKDAPGDTWDNITTWKHDGNVTNGTHILEGIPAGDYEARVFLDNSYQILTKISFNVEAYQTTVRTSKETFQLTEPITITLTGMPGFDGDWVGIYPKGAPGDTWENIATWKHNGEVTNGNHTLESVPAGDYEVRVFLNNSYTILAIHDFSVEDRAYTTTVITEKEIFEVGDPIVLTVTNMPGLEGDWIGIYPKGAPGDTWDNIATWKHDGKATDGTYALESVPAGDYEVRVFLNNSYRILATHDFSVEEKQLHTAITTNKTSYVNGEEIIVTLSNMLGNSQDWVGIFPAGAENDMNNIVIWKRTDGIKNGNLELSGIAEGNYDVRAFFNDSLVEKASTTISVTYQALPDTIYENAQDGTINGWTSLEGIKTVTNRTLNGNKVIYLPHHWKKVNGSYVNHTLYELKNSDGSYWDNAVQKILQADIHPYHSWGSAACFDFGVKVQTLQGQRIMLFSVWFGYKNFEATKTQYSESWTELVYPITKDLVFSNRQQYVKLDLQQKLEILEPDNKILMVKSFITTGGNYLLDNLRLSSE